MKERFSLLVIAVIALMLVAAFSSCTPKSAMMTKAVIIDSRPRATDAQTSYKVELLTYNIVDYVVTYSKYEKGDTVLVHDKYRNYEIR